MAIEHDLVFTPHIWGNGIGLAANAHLVAGCTGTPFLEYPYDPPEWDLRHRDYMLTEPVRVDAKGWIRLCDRPGLRCPLDEDRLAATRLA